MVDWPHVYDHCMDCEKLYNLCDLLVVNQGKGDYICLSCFAKSKVLKVTHNDDVYAYQPTELSPDGFTWKQQSMLHEKRIKELQERIEFLEQKLLVAVKKLDKHE